MDLELYLNKQSIDRYVRLLSVISDETQRRQIQNLLEDERAKVLESAGRPWSQRNRGGLKRVPSIQLCAEKLNSNLLMVQASGHFAAL